MSDEVEIDQEKVASVRRVRRGCLGGAVAVVAFTVLLISSSGNLAWSLLLVFAVLLVIISRTIK